MTHTVLKSQFALLGQTPGVYLFYDKKSQIIYIGKAKNLKKRISSYFLSGNSLMEKTKQMVSNIHKIKTIEVASEIESLLLEAVLIKKHTPKYNIKLTDQKAYPLIRITVKDQFPKVTISRRQTDANSLYFGPYPNAKELKIMLSQIRRIFPFESSIHHDNKICLYHHLGLCPCPITLDTVQKQRFYKKDIRHLINFLNGKPGKVISDLKKQRDSESKKENFEQAGNIQTKIDLIGKLTSVSHKPFEYEKNPNLNEDLRQKELSLLQSVLTREGLDIKRLTRIECFDISNFSGKAATGSMVVFINAEKYSSLYRRFKIIKSGKPNDTAMIKEVIGRRLKHVDWDIPDLIVIDGGKGQISAAASAMAKTKYSIPIIGLAKKEETIITRDFQFIKLPKSSPALQLVMRIRDEAHRFAITYHKKLRSKFFYT